MLPLKYAFFGVYFDRDMKELAIPVGLCGKYGGCDHQKMDSLQELGHKMGVKGVRMTGSKGINGILAFTDSSERVYVPSG